jgi:hypothetical protein
LAREQAPIAHHDALELPDGHIVLLNQIGGGQHATVLQMPASARPEHDWSSHCADAFGLMAIAYEEPSRWASFTRELKYAEPASFV